MGHPSTLLRAGREHREKIKEIEPQIAQINTDYFHHKSNHE